jgi:hypothetical protein
VAAAILILLTVMEGRFSGGTCQSRSKGLARSSPCTPVDPAAELLHPRIASEKRVENGGMYA